MILLTPHSIPNLSWTSRNGRGCLNGATRSTHTKDAIMISNKNMYELYILQLFRELERVTMAKLVDEYIRDANVDE